MRQAFVHNARPGRIVFEVGGLRQLARELDLLGIQRPMLLSTPAQAAQIRDIAAGLGRRAAGVFDGATMHVPVGVARRALSACAAMDADGLVAFGGGSTIGLAKAMVLLSPASASDSLPILAVPTTFAGSEVTAVYGLSEDGGKRTGTDLRVLPRTVIYDAELVLSLPLNACVTSAFNAMAHAVEGLYAQDRNPVMSLMALEGLRALSDALPRMIADPAAVAARADAQYGAWLCGTVLGAVGMALHHKLCHTLGGSFQLPHAETHTVMLPYATAYNEEAVPDVMRQIAAALGQPRLRASEALHRLALACGAPTSLRTLNLRESDLDRAAELACAKPYWNPRPVARDPVRALLQEAFEGRRP